MFTFEIGHKYYDTSACDHNCVFTIEIVKRTAKTVTFLRNGKERLAELYAPATGRLCLALSDCYYKPNNVISQHGIMHKILIT